MGLCQIKLMTLQGFYLCLCCRETGLKMIKQAVCRNNCQGLQMELLLKLKLKSRKYKALGSVKTLGILSCKAKQNLQTPKRQKASLPPSLVSSIVKIKTTTSNLKFYKSLENKQKPA